MASVNNTTANQPGGIPATGTTGAITGTTTGGTAAGPPTQLTQGNNNGGTNTTTNTAAANAGNPPGNNAVAAANLPTNTVATTAMATPAANTGNQPAVQNAPHPNANIGNTAVAATAPNPNAAAPPGNLAANANQLLPPKPTPIPGPFYTACTQFPITNLITETTRLNAMYAALFHQDPLTPHERAMAVCAQPGPLPLLAINKNNNTATIMHCLTIFYPPLGGYQGRHPATGLTLALCGEAFYPGGTPDIVSIPDNAFADAQVWHAATTDELVAVDPLRTDLLPPTGQHAVTVSRIIPLPPFLVTFFIDNTNVPLLQLCKKFCTSFTPNDPQTFQASTLTRQFLLAAATTDPTLPAPNDSQLAIDLPTPTRDNIIAQWAMGRYSGYHFLTNQAIQPPHQHRPVPQQQQQPPARTNRPRRQQRNWHPHNLHSHSNCPQHKPLWWTSLTTTATHHRQRRPKQHCSTP